MCITIVIQVAGEWIFYPIFLKLDATLFLKKFKELKVGQLIVNLLFENLNEIFFLLLCLKHGHQLMGNFVKTNLAEDFCIHDVNLLFALFQGYFVFGAASLYVVKGRLYAYPTLLNKLDLFFSVVLSVFEIPVWGEQEFLVQE